MPNARRFRPSMRSHRTLAILTVVSLLCYLWANTSRKMVTVEWFEDKVSAAEWMSDAMDSLRTHQFPRGRFIDDVNDPNASALIGQRFSPITTRTGDLESKWTALNPNMAAILVEYLRQAEVGKGDRIAVGLTGSLPGMNLALYAAAQSLGAIPVAITSVGASSWGANDPYFTWLDMERVLRSKGMLQGGSIAASLGGGEDIGRQLSPGGRDLIREAVDRNQLQLIEETLLENSVRQRVELFDAAAQGDEYKLYVNIGEGLASLGHERNVELIGDGFFENLPRVNYPRRGVIHDFNARGIPVINMVDVTQVATTHGMPLTPNPLPDPGSGQLFQAERYNLWVTGAALLIVLLTLVGVLWFDRRAQRLDRPGADPDTLI